MLIIGYGEVTTIGINSMKRGANNRRHIIIQGLLWNASIWDV
jgi:hypothetical protein